MKDARSRDEGMFDLIPNRAPAAAIAAKTCLQRRRAPALFQKAKKRLYARLKRPPSFSAVLKGMCNEAKLETQRLLQN